MTDNNEVVISTTFGPIKGRRHVSVYDEEYYSFERIPFAEPPLGELRFKAPVPKLPWTEVLNCTEKAQKPIQIKQYTNELEGSEDCLYLNVYAKKLDMSKPLPVMVYLYGGGFQKGDPTRDLHGPDYFMMKDIVLITIAYRLGALGFLSLKDPNLQIPGNSGLKDQLLGLQWVKANAHKFNGDPNNITLFGESAGAASVHYMMLTPSAKGLFHKAILMSGSAFCPWAMSPLTNLPYRLAQANNYQGPNNERDVLAYLQDVSAENLVRSQVLTKEDFLNDTLFAFTPIIEPYATDVCIIPKHPREMLSEAWSNDIPVMLGGTSFEGLLMYARVQMAPFLLTSLADNSENMLTHELKQKHDLEKQKHLGNTLRDIHFVDGEVNMEKLLHYCDYASHKLFWHPKLRTLKARQQYAAAPTYLYRFDFDSPDFNHQRIKYCGKEIRGVSHVDDLSYIFYGDFSWKLSKDSAEFKTIERMIDIWTAFAANSDPNCKQIEHINWTPLGDGNTPHCLNISEKVEVIDLPEMKKLIIWNSIYEEDEEDAEKE